jgi:peptidyl-tRNA hydrolase, PTH1 family
MILIAGLGNPGEKYQHNRHNIGFMIINNIADNYHADFKLKPKFNAEIAEINDLKYDKILLVKAHTFMNNSGEAIEKIAGFYKIPKNHIWVIVDDLDLKLGKVRILKNGGPGTHNGMKSIVEKIGTQFPRFRFGIESRGLSSPTEQETASFVLSDFSKTEQKTLEEIINKAGSIINYALENGLDTAMNQYN